MSKDIITQILDISEQSHEQGLQFLKESLTKVEYGLFEFKTHKDDDGVESIDCYIKKWHDRLLFSCIRDDIPFKEEEILNSLEFIKELADLTAIEVCNIRRKRLSIEMNSTNKLMIDKESEGTDEAI